MLWKSLTHSKSCWLFKKLLIVNLQIGQSQMRKFLYQIYLELYKHWPEAVSKIKLQMLLTAFADKHNSTLFSCLNMAPLSYTVNPYQTLSPAYFWTWSILRGPLGQGEIRNQAKRSWVMSELTKSSHKHFRTKQSLSWAIETCYCGPVSICF